MESSPLAFSIKKVGYYDLWEAYEYRNLRHHMYANHIRLPHVSSQLAHQFFIAFSTGNEPIGCGYWYNSHDRIITLGGLWVDPLFRRKGIGKALIEVRMQDIIRYKSLQGYTIQAYASKKIANLYKTLPEFQSSVTLTRFVA